MHAAMFGRHMVAVAMLGAGLTLAVTPATAARQRASAPAGAPARGLADDQLSAQSLAMLKAGDDALTSGKTAAAIDNYEAALAADPRNRMAYMGLGRASQIDGLPGKAVRYYREALQLDPNNIAALELQGMALLERGAKGRAEENLERLKVVCAAPCAAADRLTAAMVRSAATAAQTASAEQAEKK